VNWPILILSILLVGAIAFGRDILAWLKRRRDEPARRARIAAYNASFVAENPDTTPFTDAEIAEAMAWRATLALPAVILEPARGAAVRAAGTRIGGPVWLGEGEAWPADAEGRPLEFVAQVDFAELPALPDFPSEGLVQLFVGRDDLFGMGFDAPDKGAARALWRPAPLEGGRLTPSPPLKDDYAVHGQDTESTPFESREIREAGLPLRGRPATLAPNPGDWRYFARMEGQWRREGAPDFDVRLEGEDDAGGVCHVGGHPAFTQYDFREPGRLEDYDRTLLRLTSAHGLVWGDVGEANFLIRREDLLARRFDRVIFWWDCT
jgi:hypothetical protein